MVLFLYNTNKVGIYSFVPFLKKLKFFFQKVKREIDFGHF